MSNYKIGFKEASRLVLNFLTQKRLVDYANKKSLGGILYKENLIKEGFEYFGLMAWFCWYVDIPFLAFEQGKFDPENPSREPNGELFKSENLFLYNGGVFAQDVEDFIANPIDTSKLVPNTKISKIDAIELLGGIPSDRKGRIFNQYPFSFFENHTDRDVEDFLKQDDLAFVKYYYGFDDSKPEFEISNRIRVILVGVNSKGNSILTGPDSIILQHSWPPPPPILELQ
jgi:hypothetical protein